MPPSNSIVEGGLASPADVASVQHKEVMETLRLIQAGQKDFDSRLARVESVLLETIESLNPEKSLRFRYIKSGSKFVAQQL